MPRQQVLLFLPWGGGAVLTSFKYWKRRVLASSAWDVDGVEVPRNEGDYVDDDDFGGVVDENREDGDDGFDRVKFDGIHPKYLRNEYL